MLSIVSRVLVDGETDLVKTLRITARARTNDSGECFLAAKWLSRRVLWPLADTVDRGSIVFSNHASDV